MRIRVTVKFKNDHLRQARLNMGPQSIPIFCREKGLNYPSYLNYENFRGYPRRLKLIDKYEDIFKLPFEFLFPPEYRKAIDRKLGRPIEKTISMKYIPLPPGEYIAGLIEPHTENNAEAYGKAELSESLDTELDKLTERQRQTIKLRYGLGGIGRHTLREIGAILKLSATRAGQIESKALRILKHPSKSRHLKEFTEYNR